MTASRTNSRLAGARSRVDSLLVTLDREATVPLHRQLSVAIRDGIRSGRLPLGSSLPPTRAIAADLGVSRGVVVEAYQQLVAEGYLTSRAGGYTQVAAGAAEPAVPPLVRPPAFQRPPSITIDFGYGRADVANFPRAAWLRSIRRVLTEAPNDRFGYPSGAGLPELRQALADYLNRVRGTVARPDDIVICNGYAQGVTLLIQVLARSGARRLAVEDPSSNDDARPLAVAAGLEVVGVPVDGDGVRVDALDRVEADAIILTPSHQWPTGGVLSAEARAAVLRWAAARGTLVIEDDYDAEYRYDRAPIGAMQGLAPDRVAYSGTASKTLAPGLRLGWLALPAALVGEVAAAKIAADRGSAVVDQLALADFLVQGSSTGTCAECARSTGAAGTRCWPPSPSGCPGSSRSGSRPGSTWSPGSRPAWTRPLWSRRPPPRARCLRRHALPDRDHRAGRADLRLRRPQRARDRQRHRDPGRRRRGPQDLSLRKSGRGAR